MTEHAQDTLPPFARLDGGNLVMTLLNLVPISTTLRHTTVRSSLDYIHARTPEMQFLADLLTLKTEEMADRWYGGHEYAARIGGEQMDAIVTELRIAAGDPRA